jgi:hypothetical protein
MTHTQNDPTRISAPPLPVSRVLVASAGLLTLILSVYLSFFDGRAGF